MPLAFRDPNIAMAPNITAKDVYLLHERKKEMSNLGIDWRREQYFFFSPELGKMNFVEFR